MTGGRRLETVADMMLSKALVEENMDGIRAGVRAGGDFTLHDRSGRTPLVFAIIKRDLPFLEELIARGAPLKPVGNASSPLKLALINKFDEAAAALVAAGAEVEEENFRYVQRFSSEETRTLLTDAWNDALAAPGRRLAAQYAAVRAHAPRFSIRP